MYQHVSSPRDTAYLEQRKALALQFRTKYGSDVNGTANVNPFFIGVFDTVAALGSYWLSGALVIGIVALIASLSYARSILFPLAFLPIFGWSILAAIVIAGIWYAITHVQYAVGLPGYNFFQTLHFTAPKMQFYDKHLDNAVWYARHAMSIDENRAAFARVQWGSTKNHGPPRPASYPDWLDQICSSRNFLLDASTVSDTRPSSPRSVTCRLGLATSMISRTSRKSRQSWLVIRPLRLADLAPGMPRLVVSAIRTSAPLHCSFQLVRAHRRFLGAKPFWR